MKKKKKSPEIIPENDNVPSKVNKKTVLITLVIAVIAVGSVYLWKSHAHRIQHVWQTITQFIKPPSSPQVETPQVSAPLPAQAPLPPEQPSAGGVAPAEQLAVAPSSPTLAVLLATLVDLQGQFKDLSQRLTQQEKESHEALQSADAVRVVVAYELLKNVLEGGLSLDEVKTYLQKTQTPWAQRLLATLASIPKSYTYAQLDALLNPASSTEPVSSSQKIFYFLGTFFSYQKLSEKDTAKVEKGVELVQVKELKSRLQSGDVQGALLLFEDLSEQDKAIFANFKVAATQRLTLENALKTLLQDMMKG